MKHTCHLRRVGSITYGVLQSDSSYHAVFSQIYLREIRINDRVLLFLMIFIGNLTLFIISAGAETAAAFLVARPKKTNHGLRPQQRCRCCSRC